MIFLKSPSISSMRRRSARNRASLPEASSAILRVRPSCASSSPTSALSPARRASSFFMPSMSPSSDARSASARSKRRVWDWNALTRRSVSARVAARARWPSSMRAASFWRSASASSTCSASRVRNSASSWRRAWRSSCEATTSSSFWAVNSSRSAPTAASPSAAACPISRCSFRAAVSAASRTAASSFSAVGRRVAARALQLGRERRAQRRDRLLRGGGPLARGSLERGDLPLDAVGVLRRGARELLEPRAHLVLLPPRQLVARRGRARGHGVEPRVQLRLPRGQPLLHGGRPGPQVGEELVLVHLELAAHVLVGLLLQLGEPRGELREAGGQALTLRLGRGDLLAPRRVQLVREGLHVVAGGGRGPGGRLLQRPGERLDVRARLVDAAQAVVDVRGVVAHRARTGRSGSSGCAASSRSIDSRRRANVSSSTFSARRPAPSSRP